MVFGNLNKTKLTIRKAEIKDIVGIAQLHVISWQIGYKDLLPEKLLNQLSVEDRIQKWKKFLNEKTPEKELFVGIIEDRIIGFCLAGPSREKDHTQRWGEIYSIYLHPDFFHRGFGSKLIQAGEHHLQELGYTKTFLWVLANNKSAKRFYEKHGWTPDNATKTREKDSFKLEEVRYIKTLTKS